MISVKYPGNNCRRLTANEINITVETIAVIARLIKNKRDVCRTAGSLESPAKYPNNCHSSSKLVIVAIVLIASNVAFRRSAGDSTDLFDSFGPISFRFRFGLSQARHAIIFPIGPPSKLIYSIHSGNPAIHRLVVTSRGTNRRVGRSEPRI